MSIYGALYSGVSGLKAQSTGMGVISDNIANANTIGYKGNKAAFQNLVTSAPTRRSYSPGGVLANIRTQIDKQGLLAASSSASSLGISGRGFFATAGALNANGTVPLGVERLYTRAGDFQVDNTGNLINSAGGYLLGVPVGPTQNPDNVNILPVSQLSAVNVGSITGSARGTQNIQIGANLPATDATNGYPANTGYFGGTLGFTDQVFELDTTTPGEQAARKSSFLIYDSLGVGHNMELAFVKTGANQWRVVMTALNIAGRQSAAGRPIDSINGNDTRDPGFPRDLGQLTFNTDGSLATSTVAIPAAINLSTGAAAITNANFTFNMGSANTTNGMTQFSDAYAVSFVNQDGIKFGYRTGVAIDDDGVVRAVFDNGQRLAVAKIPLVTFADPNALQQRSNNVYAETDRSGSPTSNYANTGGAGSIASNVLENSTVDLAEEFSDMIVTQRNYSANARTITTSDEMLQELINIKR